MLRLKNMGKIKGTSKKPRLSVYRSNRYISGQIIDDEKGKTLLSLTGKNPEKVGGDLAKKAVAKKIKIVVFDKRGYKYHGRVKTFADAARKGGLKF